MTPTKRSPKHERVATILGRSVGNIVEDWLSGVKQGVELNHLLLSNEERSEHLPKLVKDLIARLSRSGTATKNRAAVPSSTAIAHGKLRHRQGYTAAMVVHESRILQVTLFKVLQNNVSLLNVRLLLSDVITIADEVDAQLEQSMDSFMNAMQQSTAAVRQTSYLFKVLEQKDAEAKPEPFRNNSGIERDWALTAKRCVEVGLVAAVAGGSYHLLGWIGFAVWAMFVVTLFAMHLIDSQHIVTKDATITAAVGTHEAKARRSGEVLDEDPHSPIEAG